MYCQCNWCKLQTRVWEVFFIGSLLPKSVTCLVAKRCNRIMPSRVIIFFLCISSLLLFSLFLTPSFAKTPASSDNDEFLSFLEDYEDSTEPGNPNNDGVPSAPFDRAQEAEDIKIDDEDVVALTDRNFDDFVEDNKYVMVEFYTPWNGHCKALAPEYADAATELKAENVALAKINAAKEVEVADNYDVRSFPTIFFFVHGDPEPYHGRRTKYVVQRRIQHLNIMGSDILFIAILIIFTQLHASIESIELR